MPTELPLDEIHSAVLSANPEADVWVILVSDDHQYKTIPIWECEMTHEEIQSFAISEAARFNEHLGCGTVIAQTIDLRDLRKFHEAVADILDETPTTNAA